jgi:hypothetical protein
MSTAAAPILDPSADAVSFFSRGISLPAQRRMLPCAVGHRGRASADYIMVHTVDSLAFGRAAVSLER